MANVANSVSGFYKDNGAASDHQSQMSRTQDHFASNMGNPRRSSGMASGQTGNNMIGGGAQGSPEKITLNTKGYMGQAIDRESIMALEGKVVILAMT